MKNLKIALVTLLFAAITTLGSAFKAEAQTYYKWTGAAFTVGTSGSAALNVSTNWDNGSTTAPSCPTPFSLLCAIKVVITSGTPTKQNVINAVKTEYERLAGLTPPQTFTDGYSFTVNDGTGNYTITVSLKS